MFREIRTSEKITDRFEEQGLNAFKNIQPEEEWTMGEIDAFWKDVFQRAHDEAMEGSE